MAKKQKKTPSTQEPPSLQNLNENSRKYLPNNHTGGNKYANKSLNHYFRPSSADSNTKAGILQRQTDTNPFEILNQSASMSPPSSAGTDYSNNDANKKKKRKPRKKNKKSAGGPLAGHPANTTGMNILQDSLAASDDGDEDIEMEDYNSDIDDTDSESSVVMAPTATTFDSTEDSDTRSWNEVRVRGKTNRWEPKITKSVTQFSNSKSRQLSAVPKPATTKHLIHSPPCSSPLRFNVYSLTADKVLSQKTQSKTYGEGDVESQALENEDPDDFSQIARLIAETCFSERLPHVPDNYSGQVLVEKSQTWEDLNPEGDVWAALEADLMSREGNWENYERAMTLRKKHG